MTMILPIPSHLLFFLLFFLPFFLPSFRLVLPSFLPSCPSLFPHPSTLHSFPSFAPQKTRSGKIMRRVLRKVIAQESDQLGDVSTLADPSVVERLVEKVDALIAEKSERAAKKARTQ